MRTETRAEYGLDPNAPLTKKIIARARTLKEQPQQPQVDLLSCLPASM